MSFLTHEYIFGPIAAVEIELHVYMKTSNSEIWKKTFEPFEFGTGLMKHILNKI